MKTLSLLASIIPLPSDNAASTMWCTLDTLVWEDTEDGETTMAEACPWIR